MSFTRKSIADHLDAYDDEISELQGGKRAMLQDYRDQLTRQGMGKAQIKAEIEALKVAMRRRRAIAKKGKDEVVEADELAAEIFADITRAPRATRVASTVPNDTIPPHDPETGEIIENSTGSVAAETSEDHSADDVSPTDDDYSGSVSANTGGDHVDSGSVRAADVSEPHIIQENINTSPAESEVNEISATNSPETATGSTEQPTAAAKVTTPDANTRGQTGTANQRARSLVPANAEAVAKNVGQSGQEAAVELHVDTTPATNHQMPASLPGQAAPDATIPQDTASGVIHSQKPAAPTSQRQAAPECSEPPPSSGAPIQDFEPPAFLRKTAQDFRPDCLEPDNCAGQGIKQYHRCTRAAEERRGEAA